jgi:hypothetical protein
MPVYIPKESMIGENIIIFVGLVIVRQSNSLTDFGSDSPGSTLKGISAFRARSFFAFRSRSRGAYVSRIKTAVRIVRVSDNPKDPTPTLCFR